MPFAGIDEFHTISPTLDAKNVKFLIDTFYVLQKKNLRLDLNFDLEWPGTLTNCAKAATGVCLRRDRL